MKTLFPQGGWDVHHHIFEPERFPYSPDRHLTPPPATVERYNKFKAKLGLTNSVLTHGLTYGTDCTCLSSCISELGANVTRGIGVIDPKTVTPKQLQEMHDSGVRGIRVNLYHYSAMHDLELQKMVLREHAQAIKSQFPAWTMAFTHLHPEFWAELKPIITQEIVPLGGRIVTDHFALLKGASMLPPKLKGDILLQEGFQDLLDLVRDGSLYIKISAPYRVSKEAPEFNDLRPLVRAFIDANPQQVLWGSDWCVFQLFPLNLDHRVLRESRPHTPLMSVRSREEALTESSYLEVDDLAWLNSLRNWLSDDEWQQVMVLNPRRLYGV